MLGEQLVGVVRPVIIVWVITLFFVYVEPLTGGNNDLVSKVVPFGSEQRENILLEDLGLQDPFFTQYFRWLGFSSAAVSAAVSSAVPSGTAGSAPEPAASFLAKIWMCLGNCT